MPIYAQLLNLTLNQFNYNFNYKNVKVKKTIKKDKAVT